MVPILHHPIKFSRLVASLENKKQGIEIDSNPSDQEVSYRIKQHQKDEEIGSPCEDLFPFRLSRNPVLVFGK